MRSVRAGFVLLDKPLGVTSTAAMTRAQLALGLGRVRVGHGGTLDPRASGLLPLGVGAATKLLAAVVGARKEYVAGVAFGTETGQ